MTRERTRETAMHVRRARRGRVLMPALFWGLVVYAIGFGVFAFSLPKPLAAAPAKADAIVALTGDGDRLGPAVMLLEQGGGKRLLITGVNKATSKRDLKVLL